MGITKQRAPGDPDDTPEQVTVGMADGRKLVIRGLEPAVIEDADDSALVDDSSPGDGPAPNAAAWVYPSPKD